MPASPTPPARRADATRNREKLLAAARAALADPEASVSMAEVSRRAGVGMATLYRNFPGRRELLEALYTDDVDAVCAAAATAEGGTPGEALEAWLLRFFAFATSKRHVAAELLQDVDHTDPVFNDNRTRVLAAAQPLLDAAQRAGDVRGDVGLDQVLDLLVAVASIRGDRAYLQPALQTVLDGLHMHRGA